ncbi:MAG: ATP-grasp domain-containing protein [Patescibacteria group bacterium]|jgi:biotin carboxylase
MKKVVVLGGTNDHIYLLKRLKSRGFKTILIDYLENPPAKKYADVFLREDIYNKDKVLEISKKNKINLIISVCIDQALPVVSYVSEKMKLPNYLSYEKALAITDKVLMKKKFIENKVSTSKCIFLKEKLIKNKELAELTYPVVVKPADLNSSKGVRKAKDFGQLKRFFDEAIKISRSKKVVIEEFKEGRELSVDIILQGQEPIILAISENKKNKKEKNNFTIVHSVSYQANNLLISEIKKNVRKIAQAFDLKNVPLLVQLIAKNNEVSIIEFSARVGGGSKYYYIKKMAGVDVVDYLIKVVLKEKLNFKIKPSNNYVAMNYIYTKPGVFRDIVGYKELLKDRTIDQLFFYKTKGSVITSNTASSDRPAGFMVVAKDKKELKEKIRKADKNLKILNNDKKDIMLHRLYG